MELNDLVLDTISSTWGQPIVFASKNLATIPRCPMCVSTKCFACDITRESCFHWQHIDFTNIFQVPSMFWALGWKLGMQEWEKQIKPLFPWNVQCSGEERETDNKGEEANK